MSYSDYYPFGQVLTYRNGSVSDYRYSFQGQEKDDELKGANNSVNYKYRMHDPRIGRFFAVDPLASKYPHNSPYAFSENRVIDGIELEGREYSKTETYNPNTGGYDIHYKIHVTVLVTSEDEVKMCSENLDEIMSSTADVIPYYMKGSNPVNNDTYTSEFTFDIVNVDSRLDVDMSKGYYLCFVGKPFMVGEELALGFTYQINNPNNNEFTIATMSSEGELLNAFDVALTIMHELGHGGGLFHPWDTNNDVVDIDQDDASVTPETVKNNVMNSAGNSDPDLGSNDGREFTPGQLGELKENVPKETKEEIKE